MSTITVYISYLAIGASLVLLAGVVIGQLGTWRWIRKRYDIHPAWAIHKWLDMVVEYWNARYGGVTDGRE